MTREEETALIRLLQDGDIPTLQHHMTLETRTPEEDLDLVRFSITSGLDSGYLTYRVTRDSGYIEWAEMDVNFPTPIGLNRSPLELRILCEEIEVKWPWKDAAPH